MWRLAAGLDWATIARMSQTWANRHELTLAMDFVEHLDSLPEGETGLLLFEVEGTDAASESMAAELRNRRGSSWCWACSPRSEYRFVPGGRR